MSNRYSLLFLNGRADKNLRIDPGVILAVIAGAVELHDRVIVYRVDGDRGSQSARRNRCTRPYQSAYHLANFGTGNTRARHAFIKQTPLRANHDSNIQSGTEAKVNGGRIRTEPGMCFIIFRKKMHE